jgi:hypothetical protein
MPNSEGVKLDFTGSDYIECASGEYLLPVPRSDEKKENDESENSKKREKKKKKEKRKKDRKATTLLLAVLLAVLPGISRDHVCLLVGVRE